LLNICSLVFGINLVELLKDRPVLPDSEIAHHRLNLAVSPDGKFNWVFLPATPSTGKPKIPIVKRWRIDNGRATYRKLRSGTLLKGTIASAQGAIQDPQRLVFLRGNGQLEGKPWRLTSGLSSLRNRGPRQQSISFMRESPAVIARQSSMAQSGNH